MTCAFARTVESRYAELTPTAKRIASYMLANLDRLGLETADQIAQQAGTSGISVGRFLRSVGYRNLDDLKRELRGGGDRPWMITDRLDEYRRVAGTQPAHRNGNGNGNANVGNGPLAPSLERLAPMRHLRQLVCARHLTALAISVISAAALGIAGTLALADRMPLVPALLARQSLEANWEAGVDTARFLIRVLLAALAAPALASVVLAKHYHRRGLRMSHHDTRQELKQTTGDPQIRARLRSALVEALQAPSGPTLGDPRPGHALVTNPEHIAVMLHYDGKAQSVPVVVAKGVDEAARQIIDAARLTDIPVFHFRKLARRLYVDVHVEATIPADCYRAVAVVYRLVDELGALDARATEPIEIDDLFFDERGET